jgi:hypothetical protein
VRVLGTILWAEHTNATAGSKDMLISREQLQRLAALDPAAPGWVLEPYVLHALRLDEDELRLPPR